MLDPKQPSIFSWRSNEFALPNSMCIEKRERERGGDAEKQVESAEANFSSGGCRRERDWVQIKGCFCCVDEQRSQVLSLTATFSLGVHKWL